MTPDAHGGETPSERLDVMERHLELLIDDLQRLREDLKRHD
jgi:hypothetical protein